MHARLIIFCFVVFLALSRFFKLILTETLSFVCLKFDSRSRFVPEYLTTFTATETKRLVPYLNTEVFEYVEGDFSGNSKLDAEDAAVELAEAADDEVVDVEEAEDVVAEDDVDENALVVMEGSSSSGAGRVSANATPAMIAAMTRITTTTMAMRLPLPSGAALNSRAWPPALIELTSDQPFSVSRSPSIDICMAPHLMQ